MKCIYVSSLGAAPNSGSAYLRVKGETERTLKQLGFLELHIFRPSFLIGRTPPRFAEWLGAAICGFASVMRLGPTDRSIHPVTGASLAKAIVSCLPRQAPGVHFYRFHEIGRAAGAASIGRS